MTAAPAPKRLRVLVWCPHVDAGHGERLLGSIIPALAQRSELELIRLLVPGRSSLPPMDVGPVARLELVPIPSRRQAYKRLRWLESSGRLLGIPGTYRLKRLLRRRLWETRWAWLHARLIEIAADCDLVYTCWPHEQDFPDLGKPLVCTFQNATLLDFPETLGGDNSNLEYRRARTWFERSAAVVVASAATRAALVRLFGDKLNSAHVIHQSIVPRAAERAGAQPSPTRTLPKNYFLCVAGITACENLDTLMKAWAQFARKHEYPLVVAGPRTQVIKQRLPEWPAGYQEARLAGLANRLGQEIDQTLFALGTVENAEVTELLRGAHALIVPSLAEGDGSYAAEEALSMGIPVCCSDIPVIREQLAQRSARIAWFDPLCGESIVSALNGMLDEYAAYKAAAEQAMSDPRPSWDDVAEAYVAVFESVAQAKRLEVSVENGSGTSGESPAAS